MADTSTFSSQPILTGKLTGLIEASRSDGAWQTIEQAAVMMGLSVRTINRHIVAGKLNSRLVEGRREVFVPPKPAEITSPSSAPALPTQHNEVEAPSLGALTTQPVQSQLPGEIGKEGSVNLEAALALADKSDLAITAYQTLARTVQLQAVSAQRSARFAWSLVAALCLGIGDLRLDGRQRVSPSPN